MYLKNTSEHWKNILCYSEHSYMSWLKFRQFLTPLPFVRPLCPSNTLCLTSSPFLRDVIFFDKIFLLMNICLVGWWLCIFRQLSWQGSKTYLCYSIVTVERVNSYKLVNTKNIKVMNRTQPVLSSQPHPER